MNMLLSSSDICELLTVEIFSAHGPKLVAEAHNKFRHCSQPKYPSLDELTLSDLSSRISLYADGILRRLQTNLATVLASEDPAKINQFVLNAKAAADWIVKKASPEQQKHERKFRRGNEKLHRALVPKQVMPSY
jgi:hypothetical protein